MLTWEEARQKVLDGVEPLLAESMAVTEALGRALSADVIAPEDMPPFDNSAMDGFAVRSGDVVDAQRSRPVVLEVIADQPAGVSGDSVVGPGQAVRIMTGAPVPQGADAVVRIEGTNFWDPETTRGRPPRDEEEARRVEVFEPAKPGMHVRCRGESVRAGDTMMNRGQLIRGAEVGLLLSVGVTHVSVHPFPRVGVLSTGDELVPATGTPGPGQIRDSNRPGLLATLQARGFPAVDLGTVADTDQELEDRIAGSLDLVDFLITSGGVSVGDRDRTRDVLGRLGDVESYRVAVKPGKPQLFGHVRNTPVFGLPGNPVSSLVVFDQFVLPALKKMAGHRDWLWPCFEARLETPIHRRAGRLEFVRVHLEPEGGAWVARITGSQGSGVLSSMARANGYALLPAEETEFEPGSTVLCQHWE